MFISAVIVAIYAYNDVSNNPVDSARLISVLSVGIAAMTLVVAGVLRAWTPREHLRELSTLVYLLLALTVASVVVLSGAPHSPFVALLVATIAFSGYFGIAGYFMATVAITIYSLGLWGSNSDPVNDIILIGIIGFVPLVASALMWSRNPASASELTAEDKSYHELATQLSQVAGKSEIVINAIDDGVLALDSKGHVELINPAAQRLIGWGHQDAIGLDYKLILKLVDPKNTPVTDINSPIEKALLQNKTFENDSYSLVTSSGKNILVALTASPIGQRGLGTIVVFRDITSEKAEERQQAEFISTASHEMRTPVASIEGYLGLALNPATAQIDEKARDYINKAHASAQHLGRLFQDLLDVSKAEDGRLANNPKVVDVIPYIAEVAAGLKPKATEKGLRFIYRPIPDDEHDDNLERLPLRRMTPVFYANVDNDHLREIVSNLIENAIKYTPAGEVVVDVSGDDEHITISVTDTGLGIPAEDQPHLFQKFYRVDNTATREIGGTGLGLYLCRRLAETIGGRMWVESEYKKGSTFHLEIARIGHEDATKLIEEASVEAERLAVAQPTPQTAPQAINSAPLTAASPDLDTTVSLGVAQTNVPLTAIEANPEVYMQPRDGTVLSPEKRP